MELIFYPAARTAVQVAWGWLVSHFTVLAAVDSNTAVDWVLTAVVTGGYVAAVRWLETRQGSGRWPTLARLLARGLMLGLKKTPTYPEAPPK